MKRRNILLNENEFALALKNMYDVGITVIDFRVLAANLLERFGCDTNLIWFEVEYECTDEQEDSWDFTWVTDDDDEE